MRDFDLTLLDGWVLGLSIPLFVFLALKVYQAREMPWLLGIRISALLMMIVLLMAPILSVRFQTTRQPIVAVLVDDSESMKMVDGQLSRRDVVHKLLKDPAFTDVQKTARLMRFRFAESLSEFDEPEALQASGQATNIAGALEDLREEMVGQGLGAAILMSDGGQNQGARPERAAADLGVPIWVVGIGDPVPPKDVAVISGVMDLQGYVGRSLSLVVRFRASGYAGLRQRISIHEAGREVASQGVELRDGEQFLTFEIRPERPGRRVYRVEIGPQEDERTLENNAVVVATDVLDGRVRLLILAHEPSADLAYLRRIWSSDENLEVHVVVGEGLEGWPGQVHRALRDVVQYQAVVLLNMPYSELSGDGETRLVSYVQSGGGLLAIGGDSAFEGGYAISELAGILPMRFSRDSTSYVEALCPIAIPEGLRRHPIVRISDDPITDAASWAALPPLLAYHRVSGAVNGATVLAVHETERVQGKPTPLVATMQVGRGKTVAVGFRSFWRHGLMMWGIGKDDLVSQTFWKNMVRWLITPEDVSRVKAITEKPAYRSGEPVNVHAQVTDGLLQPQAGARVVALVSDSLGTREAALRDEGGGRYSAMLGAFSQGDYPYRVQAFSDGVEVGDAMGQFTVDRYSLEYETVRMNAETLGAVAASSGGKFLKQEELGDALRSLAFAPEPVERAYQLRLWGQKWPLFLLIALFAVEWGVRRRIGMV